MVSAISQARLNVPAQPGPAASGPGQGPRRIISAARAGLFVLSQIILCASMYLLYDLGRHFAVGRELEALQHARRIWHLERLLDLPDESSVQALALQSTHLLEFANRFYVTVHFPAAILFLLWVMIFQRPAWSRVRTVIVASTGAALLIHIAFPLAPPRFLPRVVPNVSFVDTGAVFGPSPYGPDDTVANQYAAMPSLHIGWAILEAWGVITILRTRARWLAIAHPVVTTLVVVITANHYWIDGIIGGGLVVAAVQLTRPEVQARLRLWAITLRLPVRVVPAEVGEVTPAIGGGGLVASGLPKARQGIGARPPSDDRGSRGPADPAYAEAPSGGDGPTSRRPGPAASAAQGAGAPADGARPGG